MSSVNIGSVVARQIPEFVREDYPTFVAFVEAYYQFLKTQQVDLVEVKDIDKTLDIFIKQFKNELAQNLPNIATDERFFLEHARDQYLAKGSEASYKLLFRLLFGKEVQIFYPGKQMLRASDGKWNQESSVFAKVNYGDPNSIIGKVVTIEEGSKIIRVQVNKKLDLTGEIDRVVALGGDVYEFFLDKKIYGTVKPGNVIKYGTDFKATILPTTSSINIYDSGQGFRVGQVFEVKSSTGTGTLIKVTRVNATGGILHAQIIKFGVGYIADFTASILPADSVTSKIDTNTSSAISPITINTGSANLLVGVEPKVEISELGFINTVDYVDRNYIDGAYAGTILKEFFFETKTVATGTVKPAIIEISLDAIAKYPGYYETNNGFLSDSIYIQDSKYYQIFSYVVKIDERLQNYKTAVKTMIHPAGMALFGEFEISNSITLTESLESLVKALGLGVQDIPVTVTDSNYFNFNKSLSSPSVVIGEPTTNTFVDSTISVITSRITKSFTDSSTVSDDIQKTYNTSLADVSVMDDGNIVVALGFYSYDAFSLGDVSSITFSPSYSDSASLEEPVFYLDMNGTKYTLLPAQTITESEFGYVVLNAYEQGNYFNEIYVNTRDATFSS